MNGRELRDEAMAAAEAAADKAWKDAARFIAVQLALTSETGFTSIDVLTTLEERGFQTKERRALGPIVLSVVQEFGLRKVGVTQSRVPKHHANPKTVWKHPDFVRLCPTCGHES